jgi:purine-nucleoside phosphorylase
LEAGNMVLAREIIDLQSPSPGGAPPRLPAASGALTENLQAAGARTAFFVGVHAVVPGPQYETPAELAALREMGATTVSMSGAAEIRAAREEDLQAAILCVVTNVGDTSHEEVLGSTATARPALAAAVLAIFSAWGLPAQKGGAGAAGPA